MADWSKLCPRPAPRAVEAAVEHAEEITRRLAAERRGLEQARVALTEVAASDRAAMAKEIRRGAREPKGNEKALASAKEAEARAQRRVEAGALASADSQLELKATIEKERGRWMEQAAKDAEAARQSGLAAITALEASLRSAHAARSISAWLRAGGGLDQGKGAKTGLLPSLRASTSQSPNGDPLPSSEALRWLRLAIDPEPVAEPVRHERANWPAVIS